MQKTFFSFLRRSWWTPQEPKNLLCKRVLSHSVIFVFLESSQPTYKSTKPIHPLQELRTYQGIDSSTKFINFTIIQDSTFDCLAFKHKTHNQKSQIYRFTVKLMHRIQWNILQSISQTPGIQDWDIPILTTSSIYFQILISWLSNSKPFNQIHKTHNQRSEIHLFYNKP